MPNIGWLAVLSMAASARGAAMMTAPQRWEGGVPWCHDGMLTTHHDDTSSIINLTLFCIEAHRG